MDFDRHRQLDAALTRDWLHDRNMDHFDREVFEPFGCLFGKSEDAARFPSPVSTVSKFNRGQKHLAWSSL